MNSDIHNQLINLASHYQMPDEARALLYKETPLLLCGVTAAGKNTLANELIAEGGYESVISHTTREPRLNHGVLERQSRNYFFVNDEEMLRMINEKLFVETKPVHGKVYGTSIEAYRAPIERGNIPVLDIDVQGAEEFVLAVPELKPIFLLPPNFEVWQQRLADRGDIDSAKLKPRMKSAITEIETIMGNPAFQLLVNVDKVQTAQMLRAGHIGRDHDAVDVAEHLIYELRDWLDSN